MWKPAFFIGGNRYTSIGSHAGRKKNFRFVVMPVVCAPVIKFAVAPGPSAGQSSLQNSNLITPAFESGTKDEGEKEREKERERGESFHLSCEIWEWIRFYVMKKTLGSLVIRISWRNGACRCDSVVLLLIASAIVLVPKWKIRFSFPNYLSCQSVYIT